MKLISKKQPFCGNFYIITIIRFASISSFSRLLVVFIFVFFSSLFSNFNTLAVDKDNQQVPAKKVTPTPAKSASTTKIAKVKKVSRSKKSVVTKKDTLTDLDPASASSPLYKN
jgi:hypothetical protein